MAKKRYKALMPIDSSDGLIAVGATVAMDEAEAKLLIESGALEPAPAPAGDKKPAAKAKA